MIHSATYSRALSQWILHVGPTKSLTFSRAPKGCDAMMIMKRGKLTILFDSPNDAVDGSFKIR